MIFNRRESANIKYPLLGVRNQVHQILIAKDEFNLFSKVIDVFREHDPDVIFGIETEVMGIGFLCKRAEQGLGFSLTDFIQRESRTFRQFNESYFRKRYLERRNLSTEDG